MYYEMKCHGCGRIVEGIVMSEMIVNKTVEWVGDNPSNAAYQIIRVKNHKRGFLKSKCNRAVKTFKLNGKWVTEDVPGCEGFSPNRREMKKRDIR